MRESVFNQVSVSECIAYYIFQISMQCSSFFRQTAYYFRRMTVNPGVPFLLSKATTACTALQQREKKNTFPSFFSAAQKILNQSSAICLTLFNVSLSKALRAQSKQGHQKVSYVTHCKNMFTRPIGEHLTLQYQTKVTFYSITLINTQKVITHTS